MANLNITNIPAPRVPFIDERTGLMAREWYRFFLNLFVLTGSGNNPITLEELQLGPPNQPDLAELLIQINQNIAPQYEDQSGDFLKTLDTAQLMSMMSQFANAEAAIQGAYLQPVVQTGTIANYNLDGSPTAGGIAYGTGPALAVSAAGTLGQVLTSAGAGTPTWSAAATGTVTSVSVVSANGLAGTVATATTTPAITLSTTITGLLKGNGTAISAAASGTDYAPATSGTSILYGNGSGGFSNVTIGTGVAFAGGTLSATGSGGTVTSVTGTAPVVSSGGATPAISMPAATTSVNGYLTSTDWTTFNNKGSGTVTSVAALTLGTTGTDLSSTVATGTTTPVITLQVPTASASNRGALSAADWTTFNNKGSGTVTSVAQSFTGGLISVAGSPITTSGTLALTVAGTSGGIPYFSSASTWATSALLTNNAIMLGGGAAATPKTTATGTGVVTALGVNTGTAGAFVVNGGALGTPSSGTVTNLTGTASININGTVGATTPAAGSFTTLSASALGDALTLGGAASTSYHNINIQNTSGRNAFALASGAGQYLDLAAAGDVIFANTTGKSLRFGNITTGATRAVISDTGLAVTGVVTPEADNTRNLGTAALRWKEVFAGTGTINTSDAREKTPVRGLTPTEINAAKQISSEIGSYQWLASIATKGDAAREHIGVTVQRVMEIMVANGLAPFSYGFICHDKWEDVFVEHAAIESVAAVDAVAAVEASEDVAAVAAIEAVAAVEAKAAWTEQTQKAGDRYAFRYDQLNMFIAAGFNARIAALETK